MGERTRNAANLGILGHYRGVVHRFRIIEITEMKTKPIQSKLIFGVLCNLVLSFAAFGQSEVFDSIMQQYAEKGDFSGSVLVAKQGKILYRAAFGSADIKNNIPNKPSTRYHIDAITQGFTAVVAIQAVESGELNMITPIAAQFPELKLDNLRGATIHHLLTHSSGIKDFVPAPKKGGGGYREALIMGIRDAKFEFSPGTGEEYCRVGYALLAHLLELKSKTRYPELLAELVLKPLEIVNTFSDTGINANKRRAISYKKKLFSSGMASRQRSEINALIGAIDLVSTVDDLYRFSEALRNEALLAEIAQFGMLTSVVGDGGYGPAYGAEIIETSNGGQAQLFGGDASDSSAVLVRANKGEIVVIVLANVGKSVTKPAYELLEAALNPAAGKTPKVIIEDTAN